MTTSAPCSAKRITAAAPIPLLEPVTSEEKQRINRQRIQGNVELTESNFSFQILGTTC